MQKSEETVQTRDHNEDFPPDEKSLKLEAKGEISDYDWNWHGGCIACEFGACSLNHV